MPGTYSIKIDPTATPVVHGPRTQPDALLPKIVAKLKEMEKGGHLAKVTQPTDWVNSMVVSSRGEKIRICLDPGDLNKAVKREHYPIPTVEEIAAKIPDAKVFTVLDAKSGYLQMKLDYESSLLTTMNTPIGRYRWLKLPFGIKSAPEMYQRAMDEMLGRISISEPKYAELQQNTGNKLHELYAIIQAGWPATKQRVPHSMWQSWNTRNELAALDGVIYRGMRTEVPPSMRPAILELIHGTHAGIVKWKQTAREALYWPGMSAQIEKKVKDCTMCHDYAPVQQKEQLIPSPVPDLPWEVAASDILTCY